MISKLFQVYDSKAQAFLEIIETTTVGLALRSFAEAANREGHNFQRYAADYTLFETGTRDDATGLTTNLKAHINLGTALEHIEQPAPMSPSSAPQITADMLEQRRTAAEGTK